VTSVNFAAELTGQLAMWNAAMTNHPYDFDIERHETVASMTRRLDAAGGCVRWLRQAGQ